MNQGERELERRVVGLIRTLPPEDENVAALLAATACARPDRAVVKGLIERDSGICANLLFLANAPCFRGKAAGGSITTIDAALDAVTPESLVALIGTSYTADAVRRSLHSARQWNEYTRHGRDIAAGARALAEVLEFPEKEQAQYFVAGLTHDIGRAVIMIAAENHAASLLGRTPDELKLVVAQEQAACGMDHCRIGHDLFSRWGFSETLRQGILRHHSPLGDRDLCLPGGIIFAAHFVTMSDFTGDIIAKMMRPALREGLGLTAELLDDARRLAGME